MTKTIDEISTLLESFNKQRKVLVDRLRTEFHSLFTPVFEQVPEVKSFSWVQYAPYFNDGEPCTFSRHEIDVFIFDEETSKEEVEEDDEDWDDEDYSEGTCFPDADKILAYKQYLETEKFPEDFYGYLKGNNNQTREEQILENSYIMPKSITSLDYSQLSGMAEKAKIVKETLDALYSIPEDMYEELFGDGVQVTVTRSGVSEEEYDHD
jgi:hypothetical protein